MSREYYERDERGDTFGMRFIMFENRRRLEENPASDVQCPECGKFMKPEILLEHFGPCRKRALK